MSRTIADGLVLYRTTVFDGRQAAYLRVDLNKFDVRVLTATVPFAAWSPRAAMNPERAARGLFLKEYQTAYDAEAVLSGGYIASFSPPVALGFVKSDGVVASPPHQSWLTNGFFCSDSGRVQIQRWIDLAEFRDCLQAGPLLLLKGESPPALEQKDGYERLARSSQAQTFLCTTAGDELILGITEKIDLHALTGFLQRQQLGCINAIRLTGQETAGLTLRNLAFGQDKFLFPSVVAVLPRKG